MLMYKILKLLLLCVLCNTVQNARILGIFPMVARSHYILGNALMRGLAEAGHNVTVISPYEEKNPPNGGSYKEVVLTGFKEEFEKIMQVMNLFDNKNQSTFATMSKFLGIISKLNDDFFAHANVQMLLKSDEKFDVVIVEQFLNDAIKVLGHIYNVPVIALSTLGPNPWVNNIVGNPSPLSYIPQPISSVSSLDMSFTERLSNLFSYLMFAAMDKFILFPDQSRILKKHFPDAPDLSDLYYNVSLILLNSHESLNQPVPFVPNMVHIGGYHVTPPKKLPKDLQEYLDNAEEGVVYFSLGSNLKSKDLPPNKRNAFLKAFSKLKQKVLWKWEVDDLPGKPPNVKLGKWLPQQDILAHPNVKLFITHNGLLSTTEAIYHGVPILGIPVFADQHINARMATLGGYALSLPYEDPTFSEEKISKMLEELLTNSKYRENVRKRSQMFHDRPLKPMDVAVYWVEYVIRTEGAPHLRVAGANFSWFKYHSLDVISFVIVVFSLVIYVSYAGIRKILMSICSKAKIKSKMLINKMLTLTLLYALCCTANSARILGIFPTTIPSHYILGRALMKGLAEEGHNVTMISPFEDKNPPKRGSYKDVVLTGFVEEFETLKHVLNLMQNKNQSMLASMSQFFNVMSELNDKFFAHENVQNLLKSDEEFDVVIVEQFLNEVMKIFGHIYKIPVIVFSTMGPTPWTNNIAGNPSPLSYVSFLPDVNYPYMSFTDRLLNLFSYLMLQAIDRLVYFPDQNRILKKHFPDAPDIYDVFYNVSLVLLNSHESLNQPVPSVPNMVQIGGYHVNPPKKLPKDLQEYLDNAKEGVVYFSLGSNLKSKSLNPYRRDAILKAFGKLKAKVLWKWEADDLPGKPPNVKLAKWIPQQDILAHPNVKLFITHSGLLSITETVYHGVPVLGIPVFADQHLNAKLATHNGFALYLPMEDPSFSEEKLSQYLQELLTNPKYTENVKKRSQLFHDRPQKPMDAAAYWVEYVIRTRGAPHLKVAGIKFSWYKYHLLDVISFVVVITSLVIYLLYIGVRTMLRYWGTFGKGKVKSKTE
ncbi:uncharacterized protein LOC108904558 [Anoplophora glabripennis]|uniref:uncharacterized protein LOC108904558 n=1 Tax=Anoplophora glabripennis TaxID=217634 RepID=UPI000874A864|nr:uncharacterized protein LOC108904558 [Anoplophora glabripennis]